jgi:hypothetical protein
VRGRHLIAAAVAAAAIGALAGCGSSGPSVGAARVAGPGSSSASGASGSSGTSADAAGTKTVQYHGLDFQVPAGWPVYDLSADPTRCVRFDVNAVYLGHQGADPECPAGLLGRTDAIQVEPLDPTTDALAARASAPLQVNGQSFATNPNSSTTHDMVVKVATRSVIATVSFGDSDSLASQIVGSFVDTGAGS